jgi:surface protein
MKLMFFSSEFNKDISKWDVSNVTDMEAMFYESKFNKDISNWDVSNVTNMTCMFVNSEFNKNISKWNINSNCDMSDMFDEEFRKSYKPKKIQINETFEFGSVNKKKKSISIFNELPNIKLLLDDRKELYQYQYEILITQPNFYKVYDKDELKDLIKYFIKQFRDECNLNWIDTSEVTDMDSLFDMSTFNGDISKWNVSNVTNMHGMFHNSKFTGNISDWDTSSVINMKCMFWGSVFNGDISRWNTSNV